MDERPLVEGYIANFGISLDVFEFFRFGLFFPFFKKIGFLGILGPPYCGIGATNRISREISCLPYAGLLVKVQKYSICTLSLLLSVLCDKALTDKI